jgi:hypothetical protein
MHGGTVTLAEKYKLDQPVIIFGVHRSGTSLLTRMLEQLGLFVGNDLQGDHESRIIIAASNHYINKTGGSWDKPHYPTAEDVKINYVARAFDASFETISKQFGHMKGFWGMKDPRMVITLPLWLQIFPKAKIIYIRRSPADIAKSLSVRHNELIKKGVFPADGDFEMGSRKIKFTQRCKTFEGALGFALEQIEVADKLVAKGAGAGSVELSYNELVHDPLFQLSRIGRFLNKEFSRDSLLKAASMPRQAQAAPAEKLIGSYFPYLT